MRDRMRGVVDNRRRDVRGRRRHCGRFSSCGI